MTKFKIGKADFRVADYSGDAWFLDLLNPGLYKQVTSTDLSLKLAWDCEALKRSPDPYPIKFPQATSSFLVYVTPNGKYSTPDEIKRASGAATLQLIGLTGHKPAEFFKELGDKLGKYDPSFDVDAAIANLKPTSRLKIKVDLIYRHFSLSHPKFPHGTPAIISLPDRVVIRAKETHKCTEEGVIPVGGGYGKYKVLSETMVRATTKEAHRLRRKSRVDAAKQAKAKIKRLRKELEQLEKELEEMKPR